MEPCPFCKSTKTKVTGLQLGRHEHFWVICESCACDGPSRNKTKEEAIVAWNNWNKKKGENHETHNETEGH